MAATISAEYRRSVRLYSLSFVLYLVHVFSVLFVCWFSTRSPYLMVFLSLISNTTGVTRGTAIAYPSGAHSSFVGIYIAQSLAYCYLDQ
jgi:hypothetical protein